MSVITSILQACLGRLGRKPVAVGIPELTATEIELIRGYADTSTGEEAALAAFASARKRGVSPTGALMLFMREVDNPVADPGLRYRRRMAVQKGIL